MSLKCETKYVFGFFKAKYATGCGLFAQQFEIELLQSFKASFMVFYSQFYNVLSCCQFLELDMEVKLSFKLKTMRLLACLWLDVGIFKVSLQINSKLSERNVLYAVLWHVVA